MRVTPVNTFGISKCFLRDNLKEACLYYKVVTNIFSSRMLKLVNI